MNRTARITLLAACMAAMTSSMAFAQQQTVPDTQTPQTAPTHAANPHKQVARLARALNLTPDQATKLEPVFADRDQKLAVVRSNTSLDPMIAQQQMREIQKSSRDRMSAILTPAQLDQLKAMQQSRGGKRQGQPLTPRSRGLRCRTNRRGDASGVASSAFVRPIR